MLTSACFIGCVDAVENVFISNC